MRLALIWSEVITGLRRNASMVISVVLVTFVSLTFVGAAMLMQMQIATMKDFWVDRAQVAIYLCTDLERDDSKSCVDGVATPEQVTAIRAQLESDTLAPLIASFHFEDRDEAYKNTVELLGPEISDVITPESLNEAFRINLVDQTQAEVLSEAFTGEPGVSEVKDQLQYLDPLFSALTVATYLAIGIAGLMLVAAVLLIATTIRLSAFARRKELGIMRLVGASNRFIQTPFVLEGVFAALIGSALAGGAMFAIVHFGINQYLKGRIEFVTTWVGMGELWVVIPVMVLIGVTLAGLSASFAIRRWLRA